MRKRKLIITGMAVAMFAVPSAAMADTNSTTFEAPTFAADSSPDGQGNWRMTDPQDIAITNATQGIPGMGQSLRISNSMPDANFFGALHSAALLNPVRTDGTGPTTTFDASFSFYAKEA